jgi:putative transcriptional regulator
LLLSHDNQMSDSTFPNTALGGHVLIAMPGMDDPIFAGSVVYICDHTSEGAMGLILNKPTKKVTFEGLLEHLKIEPLKPVENVPMHYGGPVEQERGFVLHSDDYVGNESTLQISDSVGVTATRDILEDIALGAGPRNMIMAMGYAGWSPGQLEAEISMNGWLAVEADSTLVFDTPSDNKRSLALDMLGIDPRLLSVVGGQA